MDRYLNRKQAGQVLAELLVGYANRQDVIVLALPRGGVPVAYEIAKSLHVPLDVFIVRKLGAPGHVELAMGAIAMGGAQVFNEDIINEMQITSEEIKAVIAQESEELKRRETIYRGERPFPVIKQKTIILVDDGIATGASIRAAIAALRQYKPLRIIVAVPVAAKSLCDRLEAKVDKLVCPLKPVYFQAVGAWYDDFSQTEDEEVYTLLNEARKGFKS